jgi:uncharacterized protein YbaR (Trm112 family)
VIDKDLLKILACPETHQSLAQASAELLAGLNERIRAGGVQNVGGQVLSEELEAGLVREDGRLLYAIRDEIPVLLIDEGIVLEP